MMNINSYLTFSGNCREAMTFYRQCLGGELEFQQIGESPMADNMPPHMKGYILNSTLTHGALVLIGTDMVPDSGLIKGNSVSLMLNCTSEAEIRQLYIKLSEGGRATHELQTTFRGATLGNLTDKYGNNWILYYEDSHKK